MKTVYLVAVGNLWLALGLLIVSIDLLGLKLGLPAALGMLLVINGAIAIWEGAYWEARMKTPTEVRVLERRPDGSLWDATPLSPPVAVAEVVEHEF
jgi:hypothetical protein